MTGDTTMSYENHTEVIQKIIEILVVNSLMKDDELNAELRKMDITDAKITKTRSDFARKKQKKQSS